jgi:hypothetical protein
VKRESPQNYQSACAFGGMFCSIVQCVCIARSCDMLSAASLRHSTLLTAEPDDCRDARHDSGEPSRLPLQHDNATAYVNSPNGGAWWGKAVFDQPATAAEDEGKIYVWMFKYSKRVCWNNFLRVVHGSTAMLSSLLSSVQLYQLSCICAQCDVVRRSGYHLTLLVNCPLQGCTFSHRSYARNSVGT